MRDDLIQSLAPGGAHHLLAGLVGEWEGTARTWFEPGKLADKSPISGEIRPVLDGRFVVHEYEGSLNGDPLRGLAVHGYELDRGTWVTAWIDSFHNGTALMLSEGDGVGDDRFSVLGSYAEPSGGPRWGWRSEIALVSPDDLVITHFNVTPGGEEAKAVEISYRRKG